MDGGSDLSLSGAGIYSCLRQLPDRPLAVPLAGPFRAVGRRTSQPKAFGRPAAFLFWE